MTHSNRRDANQSLALIENQREWVIDQIDAPRWYWGLLAAAWVGLGAVADVGKPGLTATTLAIFLSVSAVVSRAVSLGRQGTRRLSARRETVGKQGTVTVVACLLAMVGATIVGALLADHDGAGHPVTTASIPVGVCIALGGHHMLASIRQRARRS
jgi:hypothetical protein